MRVHVVGNACVDTTFMLARFPLPGETLNASTVSEGLGGKGANQAVAASRVGADVTLWTVLGKDGAGASIRAALSREALVLKATEFDLPSDRSTIVVDAAGENFIVTGAACSNVFDPIAQTVLASDIRHGDIVLLQGNLATSATQACLRTARERGAKTVFNLSPIVAMSSPDFALVDLLVVNRSEAQAVSGSVDVEEAAILLAGKGIGTVIVTLGADGCLWCQAGTREIHRLAAPAVEVTDTSGAGDVFCGCIVGGMARALDLVDCLHFASAAAAIAVTRPGTLASCPSSGEMARLLMEQKEIN